MFLRTCMEKLSPPVIYYVYREWYVSNIKFKFITVKFWAKKQII